MRAASSIERTSWSRAVCAAVVDRSRMRRHLLGWCFLGYLRVIGNSQGAYHPTLVVKVFLYDVWMQWL